MKKILAVLAVLCCFSAVAFTGCKRPETPSNSGYNSENSENSDSNSDEVSDSESDDGGKITQADILYKGSANGEEYALPQGMFEENGKYPSSYLYGSTVTIDALKSSYKEGGYEYTFKGWYLDVACTQPFDGISANSTGTVTLYAKLEISVWSGRV